MRNIRLINGYSVTRTRQEPSPGEGVLIKRYRRDFWDEQTSPSHSDSNIHDSISIVMILIVV